MPALSAQIAQSVADAHRQMQQLYELNGDTLHMLVQLYNSNPAAESTAVAGAYHNPFTKVNKPAVVNNPFASNAALIQANPFASSTSAASGGGSSIFGAQSASGSQPNPFTNTGNIFGASSAATSAAASGNIFGGGIAAQPTGTASIFGGGATSTFGTSSTGTGNIFGQPQQQPTNNIFGGGALGGVNAAVAPGASVFGAAPAFGKTTAGNIFGGDPQQTGASLFGQPAPNNSIFGGGSAPAVQEGAFGAAPSVFGGGASASNMFAAQQPGTNNAFGNAFATAGQPFGQPDVSSNGGQMMAATPNNSEQFFGAPSVFGTAPTPAASNPFLSNAQTTAASVSDPSVYSKMEELSEAELAAFGAATFEIGKIPVHPPPQQLCM